MKYGIEVSTRARFLLKNCKGKPITMLSDEVVLTEKISLFYMLEVVPCHMRAIQLVVSTGVANRFFDTPL